MCKLPDIEFPRISNNDSYIKKLYTALGLPTLKDYYYKCSVPLTLRVVDDSQLVSDLE